MNAKKIIVPIVVSLSLSLTVGAQTYGPLTISGSIRPRTQLNLDDKTGTANLSSGPGGSTFIRFNARLSDYSSMTLRLGAPYLDDASGSSYDSAVGAANSWNTPVGLQDAYATTDILGELGMDQLIGLRLQAGMFRLKPPMFSRGLNFGFGSGDDYSRAEIYGNYTFPYPGASYESFKWSLEVPVNAIKNVFPLSLRVGSDLDLTGKDQKTGFTGYAEVSGRNFYFLEDKFVADWVLYYTLKARDAAPSDTAYVENGNIFGGQFSLGFGFENGLSFGLGAAADYALFDYRASWSGPLTLKDYSDNRLNWQAGLDVTAKDLFKAYGAFVHRNAFNVDASSMMDYAQNFIAFRLDLLLVKNLVPYFGGSYVLGDETVKDRGEPEDFDKLSWESGVMWTLTKNIQLDAGYTHGANGAVTNFGAVLNAIEQSKKGAIFFRAGWKF